MVEPDLSIAGHPEILVIGDLANFTHQTANHCRVWRRWPCSRAGTSAQADPRRAAEGKKLPPFRYFNKGNLATIGRNKAVADFGKVHISGFPAWFPWVFVHLMYLVEFENRMLVLVEWVYNYITRNRGRAFDYEGEGVR